MGMDGDELTLVGEAMVILARPGAHLEDLSKKQLLALQEAAATTYQRKSEGGQRYVYFVPDDEHIEVTKALVQVREESLIGEYRVLLEIAVTADKESDLIEVELRRVDDTVPVGISLP